MSKNGRYYYDADAVKEDLSPTAHGNSKTFRGGGVYTGGQSFNNSVSAERDSHGTKPNLEETRNRRSVWTIATQPYSEAHFATFPPKLIEPCIFAGSREGDVVLDPFFGAGTTGFVCEKYGRKWMGIELSESYAEIAAKRIESEASQLKLWGAT